MAQKDFFSTMMFGRPEKETEVEAKTEPADTTSNDDDDSIDYMHVMNQLGNIMNSIDELKPVFKDVGPMISAIKKKLS
ncbi:hypothetical protein [Bacillus sp. 179-C3.3 HS]|uniref:hypothetical protein n=1 Tax=Bacillus sp. 179-C3.3 HS TaxID=3232162 RepID=UPI0039A04C30